MNQLIKISTLIIFGISINLAQDELLKLNDQLNVQEEEEKQIFNHSDIFILSNQISPDDYILGPGDNLGLSIIANENLTFSLIVTPTGDLFIPSIGIIPIGGFTITQAEVIVEKFIHDKIFPSAEIDLALNNIRKFKVKILGAVNAPGYVAINSNQRLSDVIVIAEGLHRDADEGNISVESKTGEQLKYSIKNFIQEHDDTQNPIIKLGDVIFVPFENISHKEINKLLTSKRNPVNVTGYTHSPGEYPYYFGYMVIDYINMAGGALDNGSIQGVSLYRQGQSMQPELTLLVKPGDQLYIPSNLRYRIFGDSSMIRTLTAILSLYLTFLAIQI